MNPDENLIERYNKAIKIKRIRDLFEFEIPKITDLSKILNIKNKGKVYAIRFDLLNYVENHKKLVMGRLILKNILDNRFSDNTITIIDGGNFSNGLALKFYSERFEFNVEYVVSRYMPEIIKNQLESERMTIITAPKKAGLSIVKEFYSHIPELLRSQEFRKNKIWLKHPKFGGQVLIPFAKELIYSLSEIPDIILSCAGSGSFLKEKLKQDYNKEVSIIIAEHKNYPIFARRLKLNLNKVNSSEFKEVSVLLKYRKVSGLKTSVSGPHYQEINPFLSDKTITSIDEIVHYSEEDWQRVQNYLFNQNIYVGNSSAINIACSIYFANKGNIILTPIFEPFRSFYEEIAKRLNIKK